MGITLYRFIPGCPSRAVMMVIEALGIENVEYVDIDLFTGANQTEEFKKINAQKTVPVLKDGDFIISDSHAIAGYLVNKYGKDDSLYPSEINKRAVVDQKLHFDTGVIYTSLVAATIPLFVSGEKTIRPENLAKLTAAYDYLEHVLTTSNWLAGDRITIADICCVATISNTNAVLPVEESSHPKLAAWYKRLGELDFYKKANIPGLDIFNNIMKSTLG